MKEAHNSIVQQSQIGGMVQHGIVTQYSNTRNMEPQNFRAPLEVFFRFWGCFFYFTGLEIAHGAC